MAQSLAINHYPKYSTTKSYGCGFCRGIIMRIFVCCYICWFILVLLFFFCDSAVLLFFNCSLVSDLFFLDLLFVLYFFGRFVVVSEQGID